MTRITKIAFVAMCLLFLAYQPSEARACPKNCQSCIDLEISGVCQVFGSDCDTAFSICQQMCQQCDLGVTICRQAYCNGFPAATCECG